MKLRNQFINILFVLLAEMFLGSCKKLVEVDPPINEIVGKEIYNSNANAISVLSGIYSDMSNYGIFTGRSSITIATGLSCDELVSSTPAGDILNSLYTNSLTNNGIQLPWTNLYAYIFRINAAIEGISESETITPSVKQQLLGECQFLRAFMYFYLVNLYGDVPLLLSTDVSVNNNAGRTSVSVLYEQMIKDLQDAQNYLGESYLGGDVFTIAVERVRPNKAAATALLARVYLFTGQWQLAEQESDRLIENQTVYAIESLDNVFTSTSKEAIWQLQPVVVYYNSLEAPTFVLKATPEGPNFERPVYLSADLVNSFEWGDNRKSDWMDSVVVEGFAYYFPYKYKKYLPDEPKTEFLTVLRLAEVYLIRAEARAQQGRVTGESSAEQDVNIIRMRAGLLPTTASDATSMMDTILQERRQELFTEFGHRWFDLKRSEKIDQVMNLVAPSKGSVWEPYKSLYPIPIEDILNNPNLKGHQNPGYPEL